MLRQIEAEERPATPEEQQVLGRWSSWGAVAQATFARPEYAWARDELTELLSPGEYAAAQRATLNAHYTDAALVQQIWHAVAALGFTGGQVLEPGCGSGHFVAFAPDGAQITGVELEPAAAAIARVLHPHAQILNESFADTRAPEGTFDLTIGNVPFGDLVLYDPRHNRGRHSLHNHFIIKALHLTRPGGLVAVITSAYTMDAPHNLGARREMAQLADLVGAVRLPTGAHRRAAGTDAVTDLLILRRREDDREHEPDAWTQTRQATLGGNLIDVNAFFLDHPQYVLGTMTTGQGLYRPDELIVEGPADASLQLREALARITVQAKAAGLTYGAATDRPRRDRPVALVPAADRKLEGLLELTADGGFTRVVDGVAQPYQPPSTQATELRALLRLRDTQMALLAAEAASNDDTPEIDDLRARLNREYDAYVAKYGYIERFDWHSRIDAKGRTIEWKTRPGQGGFRRDPFAAYVRALEKFDPVERTATKAEVFFHRVVGRRTERLSADNPSDAITICLDRYGELRLDHIAHLLGVDEHAARDALGNLVFDEPGTNRVVLASEYLSGDVRAKLAAAKETAADDPRYVVNVAALTEVIPEDLLPEEITARLGGAWVDASYVQQFLRELLEDDSIRVEHPGGANWFVYSNRPDTVIATRQWGIPQMPAHEIAEAVLRKTKIEITMPGPDRTRVINTEATAVAADKGRELDERFGEWVWEDPQRAAELARVYNDRFNSYVSRTYDGSYLTLPGLALSFQPRAHQLAAVERMITERTVGLVHSVGAGKTSEMIIGVMELRRLGFVTKPLIAVPSNVINQFAAEFLQRYPQARLLVATSEDMTPANRRAFVARAATGDWDAVLMTHRALERIPMSAEYRKTYLTGLVEEIQQQVECARSEGMHRETIKQMEKRAAGIEERVKALMDGTVDEGTTFEEAGFDYLVVDEAHLFKNLMLMTSLRDLMVEGSQRATDLHMKVEWLRAHQHRVATFATATPFANKILSEMYNWQLFLDPEGLRSKGIDSFEQFVATFGVDVTALEVDLVGKLAVKTRMASVVNVPELMQPIVAVSDIKTAEDLKLPTPLLVERDDGQRLPETVVVSPSSDLIELMGELAERTDAVRARAVDRTVDNMLKIGHEGRSAALDLRLVGRRTDEPCKVDIIADTVHRLWTEHSDAVYLNADGQEDARRGAFQIVFCDLGTPGPKGRPKTVKTDSDTEIEVWTFYHELRDQLVARGMPADLVRFIHEADTDQAKGELFAACNSGQVAVLVGSTTMMGVGTNVQRRAIALHHADTPWRPADIEQRNGRILRQGNQNPEVHVITYVTGQSVDAYVWQTVQRKAHLLDAVMRGRSGVRVIDNPDDLVITAGMIKAAAVGNPLLMEKEELEARLAQLERKYKNYQSSQRAYTHTARSKAQDHTIYTAAADEAEQALARRINTRGDAFAISLGNRKIITRPDADAALHGLIAALPAGVRSRQVGAIGGFTIVASSITVPDRTKRFVTLALDGIPQAEVVVPATGIEHGKRVSVVTRLENRLYDIERTIRSLRQAAATAQQEADRAQARIGAPFTDQDQLNTARARLTEVNALLRAGSDSAPAAEPAPLAAAAPPPGPAGIPPPLAVPPPEPTDDEPASIRLGRGIGRTDEILRVALVIAEQYGWTSRRDAAERDTVATADLVYDALTGTDADAAQLRTQVEAHLTRGTVRRAAAARDWARSQTETSDYHQTLRALAVDDTVNPRDLATLVSAVGGYLRHEHDQAVAATAAGSQWQGNEGATVTVALARVLSAQSRSTDYGTSQTLRMVDAAGNLYSWTTNTAPDVGEGDLVTVTGKVKSHQVWQQRRETQLTRVAVTVTEPAPAAASPSLTSDAGGEPTRPDDGTGRHDPAAPAQVRATGTPPTAGAPQLPESDGEEPDRATPGLTEVISLEGWLAEQSAPVRRTPAYLLRWLHEQIAEAATDPRAQSAARLAHTDTFRDVFDHNLTQAISAGWDEHDLEDVELFRLYAHNDTYAAGLRAAAGLSAYLAVRASFDPGGRLDPAVPAGRQKVLVQAIEDHAARYAAPHNPIGGLDPARYVAEGHVPGGAIPTEWDFIAYYLRTHPEVLQRPPMSLAQLDERDRRQRAHARDQASQLSRQARQAYLADDHTTALGLIDQAAALDPTGRDWDDIRRQIRQTQAAGTAAIVDTHHTDAAPSAGPVRPPAPSASAEHGQRDQRHHVSRLFGEGQALRGIGEAVARSRHDMWDDEHGQHIPDLQVGAALSHHARAALAGQHHPGIVHHRGVRISVHHVDTDRVEIRFTADDHTVARSVPTGDTSDPDQLRALVEDVLHQAAERGQQLVAEATAAARALTAADGAGAADASASAPGGTTGSAAGATIQSAHLDQPTGPEMSPAPPTPSVSSAARMAFQRPPRDAVGTYRQTSEAAASSAAPAGGPGRTSPHQRR